jgi:uncharacterized protein (UPF0179 family)
VIARHYLTIEDSLKRFRVKETSSPLKVTIVGVKQARLGYTFLFSGAANPCSQCEYYSPCIGTLEKGRVYTVTKVIEKEHPCILRQDQGKVVEVEETSKEVLIDPRSAIQGAIIRIDLTPCDRLDCRNRDGCFPLGLVAGDRCRILEIKDEVVCSLGPRLVGASVQRVPEVS